MLHEHRARLGLDQDPRRRRQRRRAGNEGRRGQGGGNPQHEQPEA